MKKIVLLLCIVALIIGVLFLVKDRMVSGMLVSGVRKAAGLDLRIGTVDVGLLNTSLLVRDAQLLNPHGFPEPMMVRIPELYVDYDIRSLLTERVHLRELRIDLAEVTVITSGAGAVNIDDLRTPFSSQSPGSGSRTQDLPQILIDAADIQVGSVVFKDYTHSPPRIETFEVNVDEEMRDVSDLNHLASAVVLKVLSRIDMNRIMEVL